MSMLGDLLRNATIKKAELHLGDGRLVDVTDLMYRAPAHPVLRWQVNGTLLAHRRSAYGEFTVCDRAGSLTVVMEDGIPDCPKCLPAS